MKIKLHIDWDFFPKIDEEVGYFTGRRLIKERLINEASRRTSGAILISGSRGVGKTALVYESLRNVSLKVLKVKDRSFRNIKEITFVRIEKFPFVKTSLSTQHEMALLPITVNASQLDLNFSPDAKLSKGQVIRKEIIINLIRGLRAEVKKRDESKLSIVEPLYKTALATEYRVSKETSTSRTTEYGWEGSFKAKLSPALAIVVSLFLGSITFIIAYYLLGLSLNLELIYRLFFSIALALVSCAVSMFYKEHTTKASSDRELYIKDDTSVTNLEILLDETLTELSKYFKLVFIIDELDFLENSILNPISPNQSTSVINLVKTYKNLFNLSDAIFIFIAGQGTWNTFQVGERKDIHHTLFTSTIFLAKPEFQDIKEYLKRITSEPRKWESAEGKILLDYLIYKSRAEFFDLKNVIGNNTQEYLANDIPILDLGPISPVITRQGKLQAVIEKLFYYQRKPGAENNEPNYNFLEEIYRVCDILSEADIFELFRKGDRWNVLVDEIEVYSSGHIWFKNLINILEWLSMIENYDSEDVSPSPEDPQAIITYRWTGIYRTVPSRINKIETEEMKDYRSEFTKISTAITFINNIIEVLAKGSKAKERVYFQGRKVPKLITDLVTDAIGISLAPLYDEQFNFLQKISKDLPEYVDAVEFDQNTKKLRDLRSSLIIDKTHLLAKTIVAALKKRGHEVEFYTAYDNLHFIDDYNDLKSLIQGAEPAFIIRSGTTGRVILVCSIDLMKLEELSTSAIKQKNNFRIITVDGDHGTTKRKKTASQIIINVPKLKINENLLNTKEGKDILSKVAQFIRWL